MSIYTKEKKIKLNLLAKKCHQIPQILLAVAVCMAQEAVVVLAFPSQCQVESCSVPLDCTFISNTKISMFILNFLKKKIKANLNTKDRVIKCI